MSTTNTTKQKQNAINIQATKRNSLLNKLQTGLVLNREDLEVMNDRFFTLVNKANSYGLNDFEAKELELIQAVDSTLFPVDLGLAIRYKQKEDKRKEEKEVRNRRWIMVSMFIGSSLLVIFGGILFTNML